VRPAVRSAILLGLVALMVYVGFMLLVHWRAGS
jgi:hypothetical protein